MSAESHAYQVEVETKAKALINNLGETARMTLSEYMHSLADREIERLLVKTEVTELYRAQGSAAAYQKLAELLADFGK